MSTPSSPSASTTTSSSTSTSPSTPPSLTVSDTPTSSSSSSSPSSSSSSSPTPPSRDISEPVKLTFNKPLNQVQLAMNERAVATLMNIQLDPDARSLRKMSNFETIASEHVAGYVGMCTRVGIEVNDVLLEKLKDAAANVIIERQRHPRMQPQP